MERSSIPPNARAVLGPAMGAAGFLGVHAGTHSLIKRVLTTPFSYRQTRREQALSRATSIRKLPPLTLRAIAQGLGPRATPLDTRTFHRVYGKSIFVHWMAFTWASVLTGAIQATLEQHIMGRKDGVNLVDQQAREAAQEEADARAHSRLSTPGVGVR